MKLTISHRLSGQAWLALLCLGVALWLLVSESALILELSWIILGAWLVSLALRPLTDILYRRHIPRSLTMLVAYGGLLALLILVGGLLMPVLQNEIGLLQNNGPQLLQQAQTQIANTPLAKFLPSGDTITQNVLQQLGTTATAVMGTAAGLSALMLDLLVLFILAYFLTIDATWVEKFVLSWIPHTRQTQVMGIVDNINDRLTRWIWAQVGIGFYFFLTISLGLQLLGIPFALTLGLVCGLLSIIPYLGAILAGTLAIVSALAVSPTLALISFFLFVFVTLVESHLVAPYLYGRAMGLRSAVVMVVLLVGAKAAGLAGLFFAIPVAVIITAVLQEVQSTLIPPTSAAEE